MSGDGTELSPAEDNQWFLEFVRATFSDDDPMLRDSVHAAHEVDRLAREVEQRIEVDGEDEWAVVKELLPELLPHLKHLVQFGLILEAQLIVFDLPRTEADA